MMLTAVLFWALAITCCGYGAIYGGRSGRQVAVVYLLAITATIPANRMQVDWMHTHWPVFLVDLGLGIALYVIAMRSQRYWPLWIMGFHLITITSHLSAAVSPSMASKFYFGLATFWSIPKLLTIVIGVTLDRKGGITDHGLDYPRNSPSPG